MSIATRTPLTELKAERVQLPAPPEELDLVLDDPASAEALAEWLAAARCATHAETRLTVHGRSVKIAAA